MINWLGTCDGLHASRVRYEQSYHLIHEKFFSWEHTERIEYGYDAIVVNIFDSKEYSSWLLKKMPGLYKFIPDYYLGFKVRYQGATMRLEDHG